MDMQGGVRSALRQLTPASDDVVRASRIMIEHYGSAASCVQVAPLLALSRCPPPARPLARSPARPLARHL